MATGQYKVEDDGSIVKLGTISSGSNIYSSSLAAETAAIRKRVEYNAEVKAIEDKATEALRRENEALQKSLDELSAAEQSALDIINNFLAEMEGNNMYKGSEDDLGGDDGGFGEQTQTYTPTKADAAALYPYYPSNLLDLLISSWTETGSIDIALATVRQSDIFEQAFPGIKREDGSLRMTEIQYLELKDDMKDQLRNYNLNPDIFADEIVEAISGDVDKEEFAGRLAFGYNELINNKDVVLEVYREQFGMDLTEEALFAMFISPDISQAVLENQILTSQILAEAEIAGVGLGTEVATKFVKGKITQRQSAEIFQRAEQLSGLTGVAAGAGFDLTEEEIATGIAGLDSEQLKLIRSVEARAASLSSIQAGAAQSRTGEVVGLVEE
tara:strand:+ start:1549 stop:2703 length:1155 start_codon:yes stop_codon:yes gene_type:complete